MSEEIQKNDNNKMTPMDMISMAVQGNADIDKLSKLMELQERWEKNEARKAFVTAMNSFKENLPDIVKNKQVKYGNTKFDYASLDHITEVIGEGLSLHKLSFRWNTENLEKKIRVTCILTHEMGHSEQTYLEAESDTSGQKNAIQALGSTVTYLQRYTLLSITGMAAKGIDTDGNLPVEYIDVKQVEQINGLIKKYNIDIASFLKFLKIDEMSKLPSLRYNDVLTFIELKKPKEVKP